MITFFILSVSELKKHRGTEKTEITEVIGRDRHPLRVEPVPE